MNTFAKKLRARRDANDLRRALEQANTPAMRNEIFVVAQRWV